MKNGENQKYELSADHWIEKSNALNEVRNSRMTISQVRLLSIYLSKINPRDIDSREVSFKLNEYTKIMQFKQTNTTRMIKTAEDLLGLTIRYYDQDGRYSSDGLEGFVMCQIFKRFKLYKNGEGEWIVSIDCHDDALHLMFALQRYYFKYQLWNSLQLTSVKQQRMYDLLKQYEYAGVREISIKDLREELWLTPSEYPRWERFKTRVLDASQEALSNYTDIKFTWEVSGKRGKGGKINYIKFNIEKNNSYVRRLTLNDYLTEQQQTVFKGKPEEFECREVGRADTDLVIDIPAPAPAGDMPGIDFDMLSDAFGREFSRAEVVYLYHLSLPYIQNMFPRMSLTDTVLKLYDYFVLKYAQLNAKAKSVKKSRYGLLCAFVEADVKTAAGNM